MRKFILGFLLLLYPFVSNAIFHDEGSKYFFQNKSTGEVKYIVNLRDRNEGIFSNTLSKYIVGTRIQDNTIFQNWTLVRVTYFYQSTSCYMNSGIVLLGDLYDCARNKKTTQDIFLHTDFNIYKDAQKLQLEDFAFSEQIDLYYKPLIIPFLLNYLTYLIPHLIVFFIIAKWISNTIFHSNKLLHIFFISAVIYFFFELTLNILGFTEEQFSYEFLGGMMYGFFVELPKMILFVISLISLYFDFIKRNKKTKA